GRAWAHCARARGDLQVGRARSELAGARAHARSGRFDGCGTAAAELIPDREAMWLLAGLPDFRPGMGLKGRGGARGGGKGWAVRGAVMQWLLVLIVLLPLGAAAFLVALKRFVRCRRQPVEVPMREENAILPQEWALVRRAQCQRTRCPRAIGSPLRPRKD